MWIHPKLYYSIHECQDIITCDNYTENRKKLIALIKFKHQLQLL